MTLLDELEPGGFRSIASALRQRGEAAAAWRRDPVTGSGPGEQPNRWRSAARLCRRYAGAGLEELYETQVEQGLYGPCLHLIDQVSPFELELPGPEAAELAVLSELGLVFGVGPVTEAAMRARGVGQVRDLIGDRRFGGSAQWLVRCWEDQDLDALYDHIRRRTALVGRGLDLALAGLVPAEQVVLIDLETLGLGGSPIVLFGSARWRGDCLEIHQYLVRSGSEEPAALVLAMQSLQDCALMVTYNGRSADARWLAQRCAYFGLGRVPRPLHLDLLHLVRPHYRAARGTDALVGAPPGAAAGSIGAVLPDCRLSTVEAVVLGIERSVDDLPGDAVPHFYREYERRHNIGPLVPIIDHNRADLVAVARLLNLLGAEAQLRWRKGPSGPRSRPRCGPPPASAPGPQPTITRVPRRHDR